MNKFLLPAVLGVLLIASAVSNVIQYNQTKALGEKVAFFESNFGTYESISENIRREKDAKDNATAERLKKEEYTIKVYIKEDVPESQILALKSVMEGQGSAQSVQYSSAEQELANFKAKHKNDQPILQALNDLRTNPLNAILTITITDLSQKQTLINFIQANDRNSIVSKFYSLSL
ncbi:MAG: permease-like cell division protein FtsX [bacterium]|nr:permease-like cell division protein FtsX [Candidatus Liptonbacteria bacterium]MDP3948939.1 permease-like cell division protein FtsX [bacterium]